MLFSEFDFWIFFLGVFGLYLALPHRPQNLMLLGASYVFYAAWDWRFLSLILISTTVDYVVAQKMFRQGDPRARAFLLRVSMIVNLGILCIFKYLGFFVESFTELLTAMGLTAHPVILAIVLPVGISFYTFQTMSYTIDVYRRELEPTPRFTDLALYVAFFPQLVAGPIERAENLLSQIVLPRRVTWDGFSRGVVLCLIGLVKKILIADGLAPTVDGVYGAPDPTPAAVAIGTWLFAIQIYCDFSGYTDIARGLAKMMGFNLRLNFAQPYFSATPQEFWRRWHISLSTWLRDYLYISLGGNRGGPARTYRNLMATMLLGGLWHGAAWNFVAWGGYQGALLVAHRAVAGRLPEAPVARGWLRRIGRIVGIALFFQIVCYGWLLFRADSFAQIVDFTGKLGQLSLAGFADPGLRPPPLATYLGMAFLLVWDALIEWTGKQRFYEGWPMLLRAALYACMIYLLALSGSIETGAFIYFQF